MWVGQYRHQKVLSSSDTLISLNHIRLRICRYLFFYVESEEIMVKIAWGRWFKIIFAIKINLQIPFFPLVPKTRSSPFINFNESIFSYDMTQRQGIFCGSKTTDFILSHSQARTLSFTRTLRTGTNNNMPTSIIKMMEELKHVCTLLCQLFYSSVEALQRLKMW